MLTFLVRLDELCNQEERCYHLVRPERRQKADAIRYEKNRGAAILAGLLLNYATGVYVRKCEESHGLIYVALDTLISSYDCQYDYPLATEANGKPVFAGDFGQIHFNISHSGAYVVCVIGNVPNGIDIEGPRKLSLKTAKRFFTEAEYQWIEEAAQNQQQRFLRIWTMKEAYSKLTGEGIAYGISKAEFLPDGAGILQMRLQQKGAVENSSGMQYCLKEYQVEEYRIAVLTKAY